MALDDYFPFYQEYNHELLKSETYLFYVSSGEQLWAPLIEKAAAKLAKNYENIIGGTSEDGMIFQLKIFFVNFRLSKS